MDLSKPPAKAAVVLTIINGRGPFGSQIYVQPSLAAWLPIWSREGQVVELGDEWYRMGATWSPLRRRELGLLPSRRVAVPPWLRVRTVQHDVKAKPRILIDFRRRGLFPWWLYGEKLQRKGQATPRAWAHDFATLLFLLAWPHEDACTRTRLGAAARSAWHGDTEDLLVVANEMQARGWPLGEALTAWVLGAGHPLAVAMAIYENVPRMWDHAARHPVWLD